MVWNFHNMTQWKSVKLAHWNFGNIQAVWKHTLVHKHQRQDFLQADMIYSSFNTLRPRQNGSQFPDDIFKWIFLLKICEFWLRFHWILFPIVQLTIVQHWLSKWLGTTQATSHYSNQLVSLLMHIWVTRPQWVNMLHIKCIDLFSI